MKNTVSAGGVVLNKMHFVLVVSQHGTAWSLPKGHIEQGENAIEAAKREIYEESGISELKIIKELGNYQRHRISKEGGDDLSELKTIHMFLFTTTQETLKPIDPDNPEARWVSKDQVVALLTHKKDKEFFQSIIGELN